MFQSVRRRNEKNKIKAVFKLQFQATQIPQQGWQAMMVVLTPVDVGRPTVRSEKANAIDGACRWASPVYETVKIGQDKSGKISDKIYQFLVYETGSSKAALLGEVSVNLADYMEAFKPSSVTLPLKGSTGALLHATIQRMVGGEDGRDVNENCDVMVKSRRKTLLSQLNNCDNEDAEKPDTDGTNSVQGSPVTNNQAAVKFPSSRSIPHIVETNGELKKSTSFDAISASGSDGSSGRFTPKTNSIMHNSSFHESASLLSPLSNTDTLKSLMTSSNDWLGSSPPDASTDGSTSNSGEAMLTATVQDSEDNVEKMKSEIIALTRKVELSDLELQTLRKQIVRESRRGQDLSKEVSSLKEERNALRREYEEYNATPKRNHNENGSLKLLLNGDSTSAIEEIKQELDHEKNLNADLRLQLRKMQESNSELMLAVKDLDEMLEQKNREISSLQEDARVDFQEEEYENAFSNVRDSGHKIDLSETSSEQDGEETTLDALLKKSEGVKITNELGKRILELNSEVELYKKDREDMEMQMEQLALDYEILKQENHDISTKLAQTQLREQLRMQYECPAHLAGIGDVEAHIESLEKELQIQADTFEEDLANITKEKVEQEQRAIKAEEALRKARWNCATTAERLQEEFKTLSSQVSSVFNANERLLEQTRKEASELRLQKGQLEDLLQKNQEELGTIKEHNRVKIQQLLHLIDFKSNETDRLVEKLKIKSDEFNDQKSSDEEKLKALSEEINLLKVQTEKLAQEKDNMLEQNEQKEKEKATEINLLQKELSSLREELKVSLKELNDLKGRKADSEVIIGKLKSEKESLSMKYGNIEHSLSRNVSEKEYFEMEVLKLRNALENREDRISCLKQNLKDNSVSTEGAEMEDKACRHDTNGNCRESETRFIALSRSNGVHANKNVEHSSSYADRLLKEMELLKQRNTSMEEELKDMQERYSKISLNFAEVEGERQQLVMTVRTLKNALR